MAVYQRICAICNTPFTATGARAKYCSPKCRAIGTQKARKEWEIKSNFKEKQRLRMKERRRVSREELHRQQEAVQAVIRQKRLEQAKADRKKSLAETRRKAKAGNLDAQMDIALEEGNALKYWRLYKEAILQAEREFNCTLKHIVGGIDVHTDNFEYLIAEKLENKKQTRGNRRNEQADI